MADQSSTGVPHLWRNRDALREKTLRVARARRSRIQRALVLMGIAVATVMWVVLWLTPVPNPFFAGIWITDYQARQVPLPLQMDHDRDAIREGNFFPRKSPRAFESLDRALLVQELTDLAKRSPVESVVVYLAAQARTGESGEVFVLPADADPTHPATWLSLRQALEMVRECPSRSKLLVLDIMASTADPRLGVLTDDVGRAVQRDLQTVPDPHRLVLCACSPGQSALAAPDMGRTVFSYYLEEGLRGWADGYGRDKPDRRIAVSELAEFVRARVDRWAWRNRLARQTPVLVGSASSFDLLVLKQGKLPEHRTAVDVAAYPPYLLDAWKMHDAWATEEVYRAMPHLFRELETVLLAAEKEWLNGVDPTRGRDNRPQQIRSLEAQKKLFRYPPQPEPYSLALATAQGRKPDKETTDILRGVLSKRGAGPAAPEAKSDKGEPAGEKGAADKGAADKGAAGKGGADKGAADKGAADKGAADKGAADKGAADKGGADKGAADKGPIDPAERLRAAPHIDVATAAFDLLANDPDPTPEKLRTVNALLTAQEARPRFVETLFLARLGDLAAQVGDAQFPRDAVRAALDVVRVGERAASYPETFAWIREQLEEASQLRYEGEVLLFGRGYASMEEAESYLKRAATAYEICLARAETIQRAQRTLDDALAFLPADVPFVERLPRFEKDWLGAVGATDELYRMLAPPVDAKGKPLSGDELRRRTDDIRTRTDELLVRLDELRRPFAPPSWTHLKDAATRPDTGVTHLLEIEALLSIPFLKSADREILWKAQRTLARRLHDQTRTLDAAEDDGKQAITVSFGTGSDPARVARAERDRNARRTRLSIALLRLAGLPPEDSQKLDDALKQAEAEGGDDADRSARWYALGQSLRFLWTERLPALLEQNEDSPARDRLSRVFTTDTGDVTPPDNAITPQMQLRREQSQALWAWLADRSRYISRDGLNLGMPPTGIPALYAAAARTYQQLARGVPEEEYVQMTGNVDEKSQPPGYMLQLRLNAPPAAKTNGVLRIFLADETWLEVTPEFEGVEPGSTELPIGLPHQAAVQVPLRIRVKPGAATSKVPPPQGFLVELQINGRTYHHLVPVYLQSVTDRLDILLSANPVQPTVPLGELRLRPVKPQQSFYLYVRNPTAKARNLVVQLVVDDQVITGAETKLAVGVKETRRVVFPLPAGTPAPPPTAGTNAAPPPPPELLELSGPIEVRLLDADNKNALLERKLYPIGVASPREYVQVANIQFVPADARKPNAAKNRLNVGLRTLLTGGPPCLGELILPPERIPGLREVKDGNLRGILPFNAEVLRLYAENLLLTDGEDEDGYTYLTIDGCTRAFVFRTTFGRSGDPTTPQEDSQPAVRLRAPGFARTSTRIPVDIEVDNAPSGATLEVSLGTLREGGAFDAESTRKLPTGRQTRIGFGPSSPNGALLFEAMIQDWHLEMDTLKIKGPRTLVARLLDGSGGLIRSALLTVILDDSPAEKVRFVDPPARYKKDVALPLTAFGTPPVAGIKEVNFFFGKPMDNKPPANAPMIAALPTDEGRTLWSAEVPLDGSRKGPTDISVEFKSLAGLSSFATTTVDLLDNVPPQPGKVEGKVVEGDRPQAGLEVILRNEKGEEKGRGSTDESGNFKFENVQPGKYKVQSAKPTSKRKGEQSVDVAPGQTVRVEISLIV